jgi:4-amino-4-deoxy-L-arabinose transferase-like glycosyltransferase
MMSLDRARTVEPFAISDHGRFAWLPWILLAAAICLQIRVGAALLSGDLADSDPPAHFATGVMVHDFFQHGESMRPMSFAEGFYARYPKVALGHWPPCFYIVEGLWFFIFGAKIAAARWLCACITGGCALLLYERCRPFWGRWHAIAASAIFLAYPVVQKLAWQVMSDLLLAGFVFLAICSLSDYLISGGARRAVWIAVWSICAILTKADGYLLLIPITVGPLVTGHRKVYASWNYWLAIALTCLISAPFFVWMNALHLGYPTKIEGHLHRLAVILSRLSAGTLAIGGLLLVILATSIYRLWPRRELKPISTISLLLVLWVFSQVVFINLVPMTPELNRYYIPSVAPAAFLFAGAMAALERVLTSKSLRYATLLPALLYAGSLAACAPVRVVSTSAFSKAVAAVPATQEGQIVLVESDASGEGAMIAAQLERDRNRSTFMLRASKFLASSDWNGHIYSLNYRDSAAVREAMASTALTYVLVDTSAPITSYTRLLDAALQDPACQWTVTASIPVALEGRRGQVRVYHRESPVLPELIRHGHTGMLATPGRAEVRKPPYDAHR